MSKNEFIVGAWRQGLADPTVIATVEKRRKQGFRQLAYESTIVELIDLLDEYDKLVTTNIRKRSKATESNETI